VRLNQDQTWGETSPDVVAGQRKQPDDDAQNPPRSGYQLGVHEAE
jgi:hypothetical protein